MEDVKKAFEEHVDDALRPTDYPGDEAIVFLDPESGDELDVKIDDRANGSVEPVVVEARERWRISDRDGAAWALRRYRRAHGEIDEARALADRMIEAAERFVVDAMAGPARDVAFFEARLREWHAEEIEKQKGKTIKLPGGRLKGSLGGVSARVDDVEAAVAWLREHGHEDLVEVPPPPDPRPKLADLKKVFGEKVSAEPGEYPAADENGVVIEGVTLVRGNPSFSVDLDEEV